jgi:hypothetical protein
MSCCSVNKAAMLPQHGPDVQNVKKCSKLIIREASEGCLSWIGKKKPKNKDFLFCETRFLLFSKIYYDRSIIKFLREWVLLLSEPFIKLTNGTLISIMNEVDPKADIHPL